MPCQNPVKESWFDQYKSTSFNGHYLEFLTPDDLDEIVRIHLHAFGGTPNTEPEHTTRWMLGSKWDGEWPESNQEVKEALEFFGQWVGHSAFHSGCAVGIRENDGSLKAMALIYPKGHVPPVGGCGMMSLLCGSMGLKEPPMFDKEKYPGAKERADAVGDVMSGAPYKECVYLNVLGVDPKKQGQGLGKALLNFVSEVATRENTFAYLEADGPKNPSIYKKFGYVNENVATIKDPSGIEEPLDMSLMQTDSPPDMSRFKRSTSTKG